MIGRALHMRDKLLLARIQRSSAALAQQIGEPQNGVQRRPQFMTHARQKVALQLVELVSLAAPRLYLFELAFQPLIGEIPITDALQYHALPVELGARNSQK